LKSAPVAVVGGGPGGISASIQLVRYGVRPLLFEKTRLGGLLRDANLVENYPGFPGGVAGPDLAELFKRQLGESGVEPIREEVVGLEPSTGGFHLRTTGGEYRTGSVVIASGTRPRKWDGPQPPPELANRVYSEVYPLRDEKDRHVVVIGAGDAAFDYALNLARANDVTILNRGSRVRCLPLLEQRASREPRIVYRSETSPTEITAAGDRLLLKCTARGETIEADYVLLAVGREPNLDFISREALAKGKQPWGSLYLVGDVIGGRNRQTAIAAGDGIRAAMEVAMRLNEEGR
jgi:thioredoxin reductase (NADPH)